MDFALTDEQLDLQAMVKDFVDKEIVPYGRNGPGKPCKTGNFPKGGGYGPAEFGCS